MDLKAINPKLYEMWCEQKELGEDYFQESTDQDIEDLESEINASLPVEYKEFLKAYFTVIGSDIGASYFTMRYRDENVISWNATLIPWAKGNQYASSFNNCLPDDRWLCRSRQHFR